MVVGWLRPIAIFVVLAAGLALWPNPAPAATSEFKVDLFPSTYSLSTTTGSGGHTATFIGLDYRYTGGSHWGFHLRGDFAGESGWSGTSVGATSGGDVLWSGDVFYALPLPMATVRPFIGIGGQDWSTTFPGGTQTLTSAGLRLGADGSFRLPATPLSVNASVAYYPSISNTFSTPGLSTTANGNATDWEIGLQYHWIMGWEAEIGYRDITRTLGPVAGNCPCSDSWSGPTFSIGKRW
jgi:hypothetical protein